MGTLASTLADSGYAVVGLEARTYMSAPHTPAGNAADAERILRHYMRRWGRDSIVIAGYSRGADWAPIIVARLPADLRQRIRLVAMLGPDRAASYEFSWSDLVRENKRPDDVPLSRIVASLRGLSLLCLYGRDEADRSLCPTLPAGLAKVVIREGGHVATDGGLLAREMLAALVGGTPADHGP
jgi:type IV secretory pathway VirJ component